MRLPPRPTDEEFDAAITVIHEEISKLVEHLLSGEEEVTLDDQTPPMPQEVLCGLIITRLALLSVILQAKNNDEHTSPSMFLGQIAGMMMESEIDLVSAFVSDQARRN